MHDGPVQVENGRLAHAPHWMQEPLRPWWPHQLLGYHRPRPHQRERLVLSALPLDYCDLQHVDASQLAFAQDDPNVEQSYDLLQAPRSRHPVHEAIAVLATVVVQPAPVAPGEQHAAPPWSFRVHQGHSQAGRHIVPSCVLPGTNAPLLLLRPISHSLAAATPSLHSEHWEHWERWAQHLVPCHEMCQEACYEIPAAVERSCCCKARRCARRCVAPAGPAGPVGCATLVAHRCG
mmetsp:Transcript_59552/g.94186  ORF Transcript_59552/g.94186 Transcript_59552/m.94186 type:complete len:234 (-) Transcript_59552:194-895(-)